MQKNIENKYLDAYKQDNMAVVYLKDHVFELITSLEASQVLTDFIKSMDNDPEVRGLLLLNRPGCLDEEEYDHFIRSILEEDKDSTRDVPNFLRKNTRFRQINILNNFIRYLAGYHKLVAVGINCQMVTPFIGAALVADIRLASPCAEFSMAHRKYGLHPSGAIPYFLNHYLGHSKAMELQLSDRIYAEEAFRLGLINQILPEDGFRENCIRYCRRYLDNPRSTLQMTKRLNNFKHRWLLDYFDHEFSLMNL